mmetsp:Transcript_15386/g.19516  ORF Transcript_15386/g.19516 Transcript_15386/m.19516 type:complete len:320 (-) Transcript_15386:172-1131(-)
MKHSTTLLVLQITTIVLALASETNTKKGPNMEELKKMQDMMMSGEYDDKMSGFNDLSDIQLDETDICNKLAAHGKCLDHEEVVEVCPKSCKKWEEHLKSKMKSDFVKVDVDGDDLIFFDLVAKTFDYGSGSGSGKSQKEIEFERFEGYLTVVANLGKVCHTDDVENALSNLVSLFNIVPYSLNVVVFPFRHPFLDYDEHETTYDCDEKYHEVLRKYDNDKQFENKLYIMEELKVLNEGKNQKNDKNDKEKKDPSQSQSQIHPVYRYLKAKLKMDELLEDYATFFFISSEGDRIDMLQGSSFGGLRDWVRQLTKNNYGEL